MVEPQMPIPFFFLNDTATTEIYPLSLHDALPISRFRTAFSCRTSRSSKTRCRRNCRWIRDRKSTRLNSSHQIISYAVFCLKKKKHAVCLVEARSTHWPTNVALDIYRPS